MRIQNIVILLFLLSAFSIGVGLTDVDKIIVDGALNNATEAIENITLQDNTNSTIMPGFFLVLEKYIQFILDKIIQIILNQYL